MLGKGWIHLVQSLLPRNQTDTVFPYYFKAAVHHRIFHIQPPCFHFQDRRLRIAPPPPPAFPVFGSFGAKQFRSISAKRHIAPALPILARQHRCNRISLANPHGIPHLRVFIPLPVFRIHVPNRIAIVQKRKLHREVRLQPGYQEGMPVNGILPQGVQQRLFFHAGETASLVMLNHSSMFIPPAQHFVHVQVRSPRFFFASNKSIHMIIRTVYFLPLFVRNTYLENRTSYANPNYRTRNPASPKSPGQHPSRQPVPTSPGARHPSNHKASPKDTVPKQTGER